MLHPMHIASRALGACALALTFLVPVHASTVVQMSSSTSATGIDVTVNAQDVSDLYAYQFTLNFDPTLLSATGGTEGSFLPNGGATFFYPGDIDNATGSISFAIDTLLGPGNGVDGSGDLATFSFDVLQAGLANFTLSDVLLLDSTGAEIAADVNSLVVSVPEPSALSLVAIGLMAMLGAGAVRRRND